MNRKLIVLLVLVVVGAGVWAIATRDTSTTDGSSKKPTTTARQQVTASMTLAKVLSVDPQFSKFSQLLDSSDVGKKLTGTGHTVLAPSTEAFARDAAALDGTSDDPAALTALLERHILTKRYSIADLTALDGKTVTTLGGDELPVATANGAVTIGGVTVAKSDIATKEAMLDVMDGVIAAPAG